VGTAHHQAAQNFAAALVQSDEYGYFSHIQPKNWTGAGQWQPQAIKSRATGEHAKTRKTKEKMTLDFTSSENWKMAFASSRAATCLKQSAAEAKETYQLPDDLHFKAENFAVLFMKPKLKVVP
jgi:hypothetical protein